MNRGVQAGVFLREKVHKCGVTYVGNVLNGVESVCGE